MLLFRIELIEILKRTTGILFWYHTEPALDRDEGVSRKRVLHSDLRFLTVLLLCPNADSCFIDDSFFM